MAIRRFLHSPGQDGGQDLSTGLSTGSVADDERRGHLEFSSGVAYKNTQAARRLGRLARGLGNGGHRAVRRFYLGRLNSVYTTTLARRTS